MKKAIVFDLDGTLAESKQAIDTEMSGLLSRLLYVKKVAIVSGGGFPQLEKQVIEHLAFNPELFKNFYLFPTKGASMYTFDGVNWNKIYEEKLTDEDKQKIRDAFGVVIPLVDFLPTEHYGDILEDRETQFTFSAFGQNAPVEVKRGWDQNASKRERLVELLKKYLPDFEIEIGGNTSIDITKKTIDKGFALEQLCKYENLTIAEILYIGDALFVGGNDYPVKRVGVDTIAVKDYNETKGIIQNIIEEKI